MGYPEITMKLDDKGGERNFQLHNPFAVFLDFQSGIRGPLGDLTHHPSHSDPWKAKNGCKDIFGVFPLTILISTSP